MKPVLKRVALSAAVAIPALFTNVAAAQGQVTYFKEPPTAQALRQALLAPADTAVRTRGIARPDHVVPRGIVWQKSAGALPANTATQPSAGAVSAARPVASPAEAAQGPAAGMPINFSVGSSRLDPDSVGFVKIVAEVLRTDPSVNLVIEGHTDSTGGYKRNMVLSWERAMGVYRVLVENYDIEPTRLQPVGKGPTEPMPGTAPSDGTNRRVQFRVNG